MNHKSLKDLKPGQRGRIHKVMGSGALRRRIMDLGIIPGTYVEMERYAPLGDPLEIRIKGCHLSLRKKEAEQIILE